MSGDNMYERVRAAYGLDDDADLRNLSSGSPSRPITGMGAERNRGHKKSGSSNGSGSFGRGHKAAENYRPAIPPQTHIPAAGHYSNPWSVVRDSSTANGRYKTSCFHSQTARYAYNSLAAQQPGQSAQHPLYASNGPTSGYQPSQAQSTCEYPQFYHIRCNSQTVEESTPATPAPPPEAPIQTAPLQNANSVRVPFDPEDQSDDEVIMTSAYSRKVRNGEYVQQAAAGPEQPSPTTHNDPAASQSTPTTRKLSATAAPFIPRSRSTTVSESGSLPKPLADIEGDHANAKEEVVVGQRYPGSRVAFCPWLMVSNYHLWFVGNKNRERIKPYFESNALLKAQAWEFCYLLWPSRGEKDKQGQSPSNTPESHVLLVPTHQFQHFMDRINRTFSIQLVIPPGTEGEKFRVYFGQSKTPVPRFLGRAADQTALGTIVRNMPAMDASDNTDKLSPQVVAKHLKKLQGLLSRYDKNKKGLKDAKAEKNRLRHKMRREVVGKQIKRVQRYLGLRPKASEQTQLPSPSPGEIDLRQPAPHTREEDVIFVSMDIEWYEFNPKNLTEIGFGILDTRDIANVPPGVQCKGWFEQIQGRHIRIQENASMVNRRFVAGREEDFNFGESEFVKLADVLKTVTDILQPRLVSGQARKVVLVGHDIQSDINMISHIGFIVKPTTFLEVVDTQDIHQHFRMLGRQMGLKGLLNDLEIDHSSLHNGGNDAVYTLQAMLALVTKKRQESLRRQNERVEPGFVLDANVVALGWASGGEGSDGGHAKDEAKPDTSGNPGKKKEPQPKGKGVAAQARPESIPRELAERLPVVLSKATLNDDAEDLIRL